MSSEQEELVKMLKDQQEWAIINHGWAAQYVFDPEGYNPSFIYTIGLARHNLPELILVGNLDPNVGGGMINDIAAQLLERKETLNEGVTAREIRLSHGGELRVALRNLTDIDTVREDYITGSVMRYGPAVNCLQLIWADDKNILPTEAGYNADMVQPLL